MPRDNNWSRSEIVAAVAAYLELLSLERQGEIFSPTEVHRKLAGGALAPRSEGAVARRMSNISSVLAKNGKRWVSRYKPSLDHVGARVAGMILDALIELEESGSADGIALIDRAHSIMDEGRVARPAGVQKPKVRPQEVMTFVRSAQVVAWILQGAGGVCEACRSPAPFALSSGKPYLEVHHVLGLADGGADVVENAVALCPNCHRRLHYACDREAYKDALIASIERLRAFRQAD